jgi:hypothetical protein
LPELDDTRVLLCLCWLSRIVGKRVLFGDWWDDESRVKGYKRCAERGKLRVPSLDFQIAGADSVCYIFTTTLVVLASLGYLDVQLGVFPQDLLDAAVVATLGRVNPWALWMVIFKLFVAEIGGARDEVRVLLRRRWLGWWGGWSVESWSVSTCLRSGKATCRAANLTRRTHALLGSEHRYSRCLVAERKRTGYCPRRPTCRRRRIGCAVCVQEQGRWRMRVIRADAAIAQGWVVRVVWVIILLNMSFIRRCLWSSSCWLGSRRWSGRMRRAVE